MTYMYQAEHEVMATALRRVLSEADAGLAAFIEEMMPPDMVISPDQLRIVRDIFGKLCEAPTSDDRVLWNALEACHRQLFPPEQVQGAAPVAPPASPARAPSQGGPSPWSKGAIPVGPPSASAPDRPPAPPLPPAAPAPVRVSLEPTDALGRTSAARGPSGPALPFAGTAPPRSAPSELEPHPAMGATVARGPSGDESGSVVVGSVTVTLDAYARATAALARGDAMVTVMAICGLSSEDGWRALERAFAEYFSRDPDAQARYRALIVKHRR